jgi:two-component system KDP operon response regulator KdpE
LNKKVLLIDDDLQLGGILKAMLSPLELSLYQAYSGEDGLKQAYMIHPDLVILDVSMPGMNGFDVCSRLREFSDFPILMLTARSSENDMLHGFKVGADDFLRKPFHMTELEVRVSALLRRSNVQKPGETSFINGYIDSVLKIDLKSETVKLLGNIVELSSKEYKLLSCLVRQQGKIISHRELLREVWGDLYSNNPSILSLYIYYLRNKLKDRRHGHQYIRTQWGRGYLFEPRNDGEIS